jgi:hypothetical protein
MTTIHEGGCVCRSVRYQTVGEPTRVTVCHCTWCQRRTGSAFGVGSVFRKEHVLLTGLEPKTYRHHSDESRRWLDLQFCPNCGTNIGFTLEWVPEVFAVESGTFDDPGWIRLGEHDFRYIFLSSAQNWSTLPEGVERHARHFRI